MLASLDMLVQLSVARSLAFQPFQQHAPPRRDFRCRYLTVVPTWITQAERFLIEHYSPIWNVCVDGF
jgi:hypothetical protein